MTKEWIHQLTPCVCNHGASMLLPQLLDCVSLQKDTVNSYTKMYVIYSRTLCQMVFSSSLICNLQFVLLLAVFNWSINNEYVCMQCHRDKLQGQLSQDTTIPVKASNIYIAVYTWWTRKFYLWPSYNIVLTQMCITHDPWTVV